MCFIVLLTIRDEERKTKWKTTAQKYIDETTQTICFVLLPLLLSNST
jgi:hypothetical protein